MWGVDAVGGFKDGLYVGRDGFQTRQGFLYLGLYIAIRVHPRFCEIVIAFGFGGQQTLIEFNDCVFHFGEVEAESTVGIRYIGAFH